MGVTGGLGAAGEAAALAIMGTNAAADAVRDALGRGATDGQALAAGFWAGAAEVVFERFSLENFLKIKGSAGQGDFILHALMQSGVEASEEAATQLANIITDAWVMGGKSYYSQAVASYQNQGFAPGQAQWMAQKDFWGEISWAAAGGFLSGVFVGGTGHVAGRGYYGGLDGVAYDYNLYAVPKEFQEGLGSQNQQQSSNAQGDVLEDLLGPESAGQYTGLLSKVTKPDAAADALADRIGGQSRVRFSNDPMGREFDVVSSEYIGQTKPALQSLNKNVRNQMKATFEAAQATGRKVYYHFDGQPINANIKVSQRGQKR